MMYPVSSKYLEVRPGEAIRVMWRSGSPLYGDELYRGATVKSFDYKRYQNGAVPAFTPIRFPGQYEDAETGLFENWNRFYDPTTG